MRKIIVAVILTLLIFLLNVNANAVKWEYLASRGIYSYYYDSDNVQQLSEITFQIILDKTYKDKKSVMKFFQKYATKDDSFDLEDYVLSTMVMNCSDKTVGVKSITSYKKNGEIILHTNYDEIYYIYIPAGSIYKALYFKVC